MTIRARYNLILGCLACLLWAGCGHEDNSSAEISSPVYPFNNKNKELSYVTWGETVPDPYRWLENIDDQRVLNWAKKQNQTTFDYINQLPQRVKILKKLESISVKKEYKKAKRDGQYYFYTLTLERPNKEIVYYSSVDNSDEKLFVDPQLFSGNENARFASLSVSPDSKYAAFSLQDPLSKREKIFIKNLETNRFMRDIVAASYNSTIAWDNEGGFFYNKGFSSDYSKDSVEHAVFYHVPGENPGKDIPVFTGAEYPKARNDLFITSNQRFVVIRSSVDENTSEIRYTDLYAPPPNTFKLLTSKAGANAYIVDNIGEKLIILTTTGASKGRVVVVDPEHPEEENWKTLISETQDIIQRVYALGNKFYVRSSAHMSGKVTAYDTAGSRLYSVELPGNGIVEGFSGRPGYSDVLYTYQSFNYPLTIFRYSPSQNKSEVFKRTETKITSDDYVIKKEFCLTSEGIGIPLLIFHKKGMAADGSHPLILSFSGGMNESYMPGYSFGYIPFVDNGGVFVLASVRGGNEFDKKWHDAGAKKNRPQMERDVKECLDYLIQEKYTSAGKIGILTKHAGAAAAIENAIKNPGLIKLVGIFQGIFDLTGYRNYPGCVACIENELGNPDESKEVFDALDESSPLRRTSENHTWPAVYLEHKIIDPVVSPVHSFKFIASLQDNSKDQLPKLIRIDNECCVQNRRQELFVLSERWAFAMYMLGVEVK